MHFKNTNFYYNIKLKSHLTFLILMLFAIMTSAAPSYKMELRETVIDNNQREISIVMLSDSDTSIELTSYQCALSLNQTIDLSNISFNYIARSSELVNEPNLFVGMENIDGENEITFVSYIGHDIITNAKETIVGKFLLEGTNIGKVKDINLQWNFDGTISTIITGKNFENITNPKNHKSSYTKLEDDKNQPTAQRVAISSSEASAVGGNKLKESNLYDGITSSSNGGNYNSSSEGRWAAAGFPQWVTIDLGSEVEVENIKINGFGSENGITYDCEFYSGTNSNKSLIKKETTASGTQWSEHSLDGTKTRYVTVVITGSEGNDWCDIWEMEVYGIGGTAAVEDNKEEETLTEDNIPNEFGISQNYPNPFNPTTKVEVRMKESGSARLDVYNILGEKVLSVLDEELSAGFHEVNIDGTRLASGIYIYALNIDNKFSQTKKMNLIK